MWHVVAVALVVAGCGDAESRGQTAVPAPTESPTPAESPMPTEPTANNALPADLHAVVFFRTERGNEHLDVQVLSDATSTAIAGVRADESRGNPVRVRIELSATERTEYVTRIAALADIPRCEPIAHLPDEPTFHIEGGEHDAAGPSLWFRANGPTLLASDDPCLGYVRLAQFVYATWMSHTSE